jgi:hypothetical protein
MNLRSRLTIGWCVTRLTTSSTALCPLRTSACYRQHQRNEWWKLVAYLIVSSRQIISPSKLSCHSNNWTRYKLLNDWFDTLTYFIASNCLWSLNWYFWLSIRRIWVSFHLCNMFTWLKFIYNLFISLNQAVIQIKLLRCIKSFNCR